MHYDIYEEFQNKMKTIAPALDIQDVIPTSCLGECRINHRLVDTGHINGEVGGPFGSWTSEAYTPRVGTELSIVTCIV